MCVKLYDCTNKSSRGLRPPQQPIMPIYSLCSTWCCGGRRPPLLFFAPIVAFCHRAPNAAQSDCVRRPIGFRPPPDRIPSAARSDCVRRPIGLRPPSDRIPSAAQSDSVRRPIGFRPPPDQIASAVRRLMLRDRACVTTIIYIKLLLSGKQLFTLILFCCSVFYSNIY